MRVSQTKFRGYLVAEGVLWLDDPPVVELLREPRLGMKTLWKDLFARSWPSDKVFASLTLIERVVPSKNEVPPAVFQSAVEGVLKVTSVLSFGLPSLLSLQSGCQTVRSKVDKELLALIRKAWPSLPQVLTSTMRSEVDERSFCLARDGSLPDPTDTVSIISTLPEGLSLSKVRGREKRDLFIFTSFSDVARIDHLQPNLSGLHHEVSCWSDGRWIW
jgi:hypothetical protein